jgi:hypothetical protein
MVIVNEHNIKLRQLHQRRTSAIQTIQFESDRIFNSCVYACTI